MAIGDGSARLTIAVVGRNDDYDGDFATRLLLASRFNLDAVEGSVLLLVEWNPVPDKELLSKVLNAALGSRIACYVVCPDRSCRQSEEVFPEFLAKNVGIRRSGTEFVLCTNSGVLFSPEVSQSLNGKLDKGICYTATRWDIQEDYRQIAFPVPEEAVLRKGFPNPTDAPGDFTLLDRDTWRSLTGYCEKWPEQRLHKDAELIYRVMRRGLEFRNLGVVLHWQHSSSYWCNPTVKGIGSTSWDYQGCGFVANHDTWGLRDAVEEERDGIKWLFPSTSPANGEKPTKT